MRTHICLFAFGVIVAGCSPKGWYTAVFSVLISSSRELFMVSRSALAILASVFAIPDLIGDKRTQKLEGWLYKTARDQAVRLRDLTVTILRQSVVTLLFVGCVSLFSPWVALFCLGRDGPTWRWLTLFIIVPIPTAIGLSLLQTALLPLGRRYLAGQFEGALFRFAERFLDKLVQDIEEQRRKNDNMPFPIGGRTSRLGLGPIVAIPMLLALSMTIVGRLLVLLGVGSVWIAWGIPVIGLAAAARRVGNSSFFKVGKFVLCLVAIVAAFSQR
jgi:hypothetical protein